MKEKHTYRHVDTPGKLPEALGGHLGVPDGYFEQLTDSITARITEQTLKAKVTEPGFVVPTGYFSALEEQLLATRKIQEQVTDTGFVVPRDYFDMLPGRITAQTHQAATPVRRLSRPKWVAYAAAASIALVVGLASLFKIANDTPETTSPLASVSDEQIVNYLELYGPPNDMIYISDELDSFDEQSIGEGISDADIEAYLNHTL